MQKRNYFIYSFILFLGLLFFQSCSDDDSLGNVNSLKTADSLDDDLPGEIKSFDMIDLKAMKTELEKNGYDVSNLLLDDTISTGTTDTRGIWIPTPFVRAVKVTTKTLHPDRSGRYIDVSGVLLVPRKTLLTGNGTYRIAVVTPPTYTYNDLAPSNAFKRMSLVTENQDLNLLYYWVLQAESGYVVFIPDYPGFGDSYKECFHPYLDQKALVNSTLDLFKVARNKLSALGYRYKKDLVLSGYSQGAFVATSLAREIETNPSRDLSVKLLFTGGTPCNLNQIVDIVRASDHVQHSYFLAYGIWGYKENAYPNINVSDFLLKPYDTTSLAEFDGTHSDVNDDFPHVPAQMYTEKFMKDLDIDPSVSYLRGILAENSIQPWKNKCEFMMTHGRSDVSVYYQNAKDFADKQNKAGGKVTFYPTLGDHVTGFVPYTIRLSLALPFYQ